MPADRLGMPEPYADEQLKSKLARLTVGRFAQARYVQMDTKSVDVAINFVQAQNWVDRGEIAATLKSATSDTGTSDFPSTLNPISEAFLHALQPLRIAGRLTGLRSAPLRTTIYANTSAVTAAQVVEHGRIPVLGADYTRTQLEPRKFAGIIVVTEELIKSTSTAAQTAITDDLAAAVAAAEDLAFISPSEAGSVLYGAPSVASTGTTLAAIDTDLRALVALVPGAGHPGAALTMSKETAAYLGTLRGTAGAPAFPDVGPQGGSLITLPVLVSSAAEGTIGLLNPGEILYAHGEAILITGRDTSLMMDSDPEAVTNPVSMFEADAVAVKGLRRAGWYARTGAAAYISGVTY